MKDSIPELEALRLLMEQCRHIVVSQGQDAFSKTNAKEARRQADRLDLLETAESSLDTFESALAAFPELLQENPHPSVPTSAREITHTSIISPEVLGERVSITSSVANATGYWDGHIFTVEAGSQMRVDEVPSIHEWLKEHRAMLIETGTVKLQNKHYVFVYPATFTSPSAAAGVVLGRSANGRQEWRLPDGSPLGTLTQIVFGEESE